jgi:predicted MPP superfamily phosphohydrolase
MTRRRWLAAAGAAAAAAAYPFVMEPRWFEVRRWRLRLFGGVGEPLRLLHLSDLHHSLLVPHGLIETAFDLGLALRPDLICVTGDFITQGFDFDRARYIALLRRLPAAAPAFATLGNHDGGSWAAERNGFSSSDDVRTLLVEAGLRVLYNASDVVEARGRRLRVAGVGDHWSHEIDATAAFAGVDGTETTVLLSHNPDSKRILSPYPWRLMLSGHTHGGQLVLPGDRRPFAPVRDLRYVEGLKPWGDRWIEVTRGVGSMLGVRINCRPEVTVIELA